jgi:L-malate glycosyltransferase
VRIVYVAYNGSVHTRRWVRFFAERGHEVHVVTCGGSEVHDLGEDGVALPRPWVVHDLGAPRFGRVGYLLKLRAARKAIRLLDADVVHAHWATSYGLLALWSGARPLVVTAHGDDVLIAPRKRAYRWLVQRVLRAARLITVPSEQMRTATQRLLGPDAPEIAVFQYGVEVARLAAVGGERVRSEKHPLRIVSARALLDLYRIDALIDALADLRSRGVDFSCDIAGDGPLREQLEQQVRDLGLDSSVRFHGHLESHAVERLIAAADVYVSVSESDGVSLSLLEALAIGVVPVLSDIPANRDWVNNGETGALVQIDPASIADGIERASQLDFQRVAHDNRALVAERADRETNLGACELLIDSLCGVQWDPRPVRGSDAA